MKKTIKSLLAIAIAAFAFTACSDVPEPYQIPGSSSGGGDTPEGTYVSESFETSFGSFTVKTIKGTPWVIDFKTAKATGYDGSVTTPSEAYLVSSPIDLSQSKGAYLEFDYILRYVKAGQTENKVFATSNYTGDPTTTKWTDITGTLTEGKDWTTFAKYQTNLPAEMIGQSAVVLAMYYSCTTSSSTIEIKNLKVIEGSTGGGGGDAIEVTCAEAVTATNKLADGATSTETYAVTGYITEVVGSVSRNQQTFWIADTKDGGKVFEAYYADLPDGVTEFKKGMKVKITGNLIKFVNSSTGAVTPEIKNAKVEILESGDEPGGGGGDVISVTCAEAVTATNKLADGATSTETYAVTGYITEVVGSVSRNQQTFWMADTKDGGKVFEAYYADLPSGISAFAVGMKVKITGNLMKFVNSSTGAVTPEIKNATVEILEGGGESGGDQGGGSTVTSLINGGFEEWTSDAQPTGWKSASSASSATLAKSTDAHSGNFSCNVNGGGTANKRLATQEITLAAGTYKFSFYAKATTTNVAQVRSGYAIVKDGSIANSDYKYNSTYFDINNNGWTLIENEFTLDAETVVCLLVMNPKTNAGKTSGEDILVDDATLTKK